MFATKKLTQRSVCQLKNSSLFGRSLMAPGQFSSVSHYSVDALVQRRNSKRLQRAHEAVQHLKSWQVGDDIPLQAVLDINSLPANEWASIMEELHDVNNRIPDIDLTAKGDPAGLYDPSQDPDGKMFHSQIKDAMGSNYTEDMFYDFVDMLKLEAKQSEQLARISRNHRTPVNEQWYEPPLVRIHEKNPNPLPGLAHNRPGEEDQTDGEWFALTTDFESMRGIERAEYLDPTLWDDMLPELVDVNLGAGSSMFNPIVVKSQGEPFRVTGCYGDCGEPEHRDTNDETLEMQWFRLYENQYSLCIDCGLWYYCACPQTVAQMKVNALLLEDEDVLREYLQVNARELVKQGKISDEEATKMVEEDMDIVDENVRLKNREMLRVVLGKQTHWEATANFHEGARVPTLASELYEMM
uniref:Uncharacterized protein n=1 Tax=Percolomonas cosmopolitus TaxID=63605 RepID=A0A7S1KPT1_9EUKA|mmetsp:Transcript_3377/g.12836  ORF Transcript_3377/g.12836 Transcript_3377/m.12836 type:complete len:411 (+) Transcript_3377:159-1391(+)|eukprot:CAMPEP_0117445508 /NCGR_PEP_ID=MMETSP0759-20121206/5834_1 /TAXON_ID=63605 /ORGANISM="Percolomonas cosmopolitus, Strain WS" /LENGTH=410 /DNA_ID=CAMNT_0005237691 /DNA_START=143 /DNA_END=1375 /DNA_ORIENTATION=-